MKTQIIYQDRLIALWDVAVHIDLHSTVLVGGIPWTVYSTSYSPPGTDPERQDVYVKSTKGWVDGWIPRANQAPPWPVEVITS